MLSDASFQELLTGGLDDHWIEVTRKWIDDGKERAGLTTDQEAIAAFSDSEIVPRLVDAGLIFGNKELWKYDFIGLPTPRFSVQLVHVEGQHVIAVHEGFLHLMSFLIGSDLLKWVLFERLSYLGADSIQQLDLRRKLATLRIAKCFLVNPFRLPLLRDEFTDDMKKRLDDELISILTFAILHEVAHFELGHTRHFSAGSAPSRSPHLVIEESLGFFKQQEFAADEHAISGIRKSHSSFFAGICVLLSQLAMLDTYSVKESQTHPMAVNRLSHLQQILPPECSREINEILSGLLIEISQTHEAQRDDDMHWKVELLALAGPTAALADYGLIAGEILKGNKIIDKYRDMLPVAELSKTIGQWMSQGASDPAKTSRVAGADARAAKRPESLGARLLRWIFGPQLSDQ